MTNTPMTEHEDLKDRILARKLELETKLEHFKTDTADKTADIAKCIQKDLDDLGVKIAHGWENLSEHTVHTLNEWFKHTDSH
jgi:hypothetical protein